MNPKYQNYHIVCNVWTTHLFLHFLFDFGHFFLLFFCKSFYKTHTHTVQSHDLRSGHTTSSYSTGLSPLASSLCSSLASTFVRRSIILVLGGLPGRRPSAPLTPRIVLGFSLSGFGGRPRRPVMAMIMEGISSLAKMNHFMP